MFLCLGSILCLGSTLGLGSPGAVRGEETAEVKADQLFVDHEKKSAHFEGHVRATVGVLKVSCDRLDLTYDASGEIVALVASGGVTVTHTSSTAVAGTARLDAKKGILILEGNPSLTRGPHRLQGSRIAFHLETGRLEVDDAKGTFSLKKGAVK